MTEQAERFESEDGIEGGGAIKSTVKLKLKSVKLKIKLLRGMRDTKSRKSKTLR